MLRREFLQTVGTTVVASAAGLGQVRVTNGQADAPKPLMIDTHQHLWDLTKLKLPWLDTAPQVLKQSYHHKEYREAIEGFNMRAVYMEVHVDESHLNAEAEHVIGLSKAQGLTIGAVIGGRPEAANFASYVDKFKGMPEVKGVRRVLHTPETPAGSCLKDTFVQNVKLLGKRGLSFDLCMRPGELDDALRLTELCPDTRFILDHCGNADPKAFRKTAVAGEKPDHDANAWKKAIERLAKRPNLLCKISGVIARLPMGGGAEDLAPIVNHCLDSFGPDRVIFGSDWPVCLLGAPLKRWVLMLTQIIATRSAADRKKLWSENALKHYGLKLA